MMTLQQLRIFLLLAQTKKMSLVAQQLGLTQPTVTFHLHSLEADMGVPLFVPGQKGYFLSEAGQALLHYAQRVITLTDEAERMMRDFRESQKGKLIVGASHIPATYLLPIVIQKFLKTFPQFILTIQCEPGPRVIREIESRTYDMGFVIGEPVIHPELESIHLLEDQIGLAAHPSLGLQWLKSPVHPNDLESVDLIVHTPESTTRRVCDKWFHEHQLTPRILLELGSTEAIKKAVQSGIGVGILSKLAVQEECARQELLFIPIQSPPLRLLQVILQKDRWRTPAMDLLIQASLSVAAQNSAASSSFSPESDPLRIKK